jgi:hypothetical protein
MTFALSGFMLYTMWVVLALIGIDFLAGIYNHVRSNTFTFSELSNFLNGLLYYVFPLIILVNLMPLDPTEWIVQIAYYVGVVGVIIKYLLDIQNKL